MNYMKGRYKNYEKRFGVEREHQRMMQYPASHLSPPVQVKKGYRENSLITFTADPCDKNRAKVLGLLVPSKIHGLALTPTLQLTWDLRRVILVPMKKG